LSLEYKRFPKSEFESRWKRTSKLMEKKSLDALLVTEGLNFIYLGGGFRDFSHSRPTIMVLPKDGSPVIMVHEFFESAFRRQTWVEDVRSYPSLRTPIELIKEVMGELKLTRGKIGAELGYEQRLGIPYNDFIRIKDAFPGAEFVDASDVLWGVRMVKSNAEIECHRKAVDISCKAIKKCFETVKEGMTDTEAVNILIQEHIRSGGATPFVSVNSGPYNFDSGCDIPGNHILEKGNLLWYDFGCTHKGRWSDLSGGIVIGNAPSERQKRMQENVMKITRTIIEAIKPGIKASDLSRIADNEFKRAGLADLWGRGDCAGPSSNKAGRIGHGIGLLTTEPPHIAKYDDTVLRPGMVITAEPGIVTDYGHFHAEDDVLVTEDGHEVLSKIPRELII